MRKTTALHNLERADEDLTKLIKMLQQHANCLTILSTSYQIQKAIKQTRIALLNRYLENCLTDVLYYNKKEKIQEVTKAIQYL